MVQEREIAQPVTASHNTQGVYRHILMEEGVGETITKTSNQFIVRILLCRLKKVMIRCEQRMQNRHIQHSVWFFHDQVKVATLAYVVKIKVG